MVTNDYWVSEAVCSAYKTKHCRLGGWTIKMDFLTVPEAGSWGPGLPARSGSDRALFLPCRGLPSWCVLTWQRESSCLFLCEEGHSGPFMMAPHSWPPRNLINYKRPSLQITSHWRCHTGIWGRHNPATVARTLLTNICTIKCMSNKTVYAYVRRWKVRNKSRSIIKNISLAVYFYFNKFLWLELSPSLSPLCPHP